MYEWTELMKLWEQERLTPEQMIGQLLRHGQQLQNTQLVLQRRLEMLEQALEALLGGGKAKSGAPRQRD
ncbi:MAG: hypothetical protein U0350_19620 [Caldilineaceae bacterium]